MAVLGRWTGGTISSMVPGTTWGAPNGLFPTQARNDSSTYTWTSSTSTLTLPASSLADGYLLRASVETEDNTNGRYNIQGRFQQASGTGNFVTCQTSGFSRDASEDRAFLQVVAFVDNPSASATFQFEWQRDVDAPSTTDGTVNSAVEVIPFYYSNAGLYTESTATQWLNGTTPTTVTLGTTVLESDATNAISRSGNVITVKGDNKRYWIIGNVYADGFSGGARTQRFTALQYDSTTDDATRGYLYARNTSNDLNGALSWDVLETAITNRTIEVVGWQGDTTDNTANAGGAESPGNGPSTNSNYHALIVLELNDSAEVFRSHDATGAQSLATAGTTVDLNIARTTDIDFNDSASFTRASDTAFNAEKAMDALIGANIGLARTDGATTRATHRSHITVNGTEDNATRHGNYSRGDQTTTGTFGGGSTPGGFVALSSGDDIGLSAGKITGSEAGTDRTQPGWTGFWGINLDTLESGGVTHYTLTASSGTYTQGGQASALTKDSNVAAGAGSISLTGQSAGLLRGYVVSSSVGSFSVNGVATSLRATRALVSDSGGFSSAGFDAGLKAARSLTSEAGGFTQSGQDASLRHAWKVAADNGVYALSGQDATLSYTPASNDYSLTADAGSVSMLGQAASLRADRVAIASSGAYAVTGYGAGLAYGRRLTSEAGVTLLSGQAASFIYGRGLSAGYGAIALSGQSVSFLRGRSFITQPAEYSVAGNQVALRINGYEATESASTAWANQSDQSTSWTPHSASSDVWTDKADESSNWTDTTDQVSNWN